MSSTPTGIAALRMYDLREIRGAIDELWRAISDRLPAPSVSVSWDGDCADQWLDPDLILGQSCGWPLATWLASKVTVVGAFSYYGIENEPGPVYRSVVVARELRSLPSFRGTIAAVNDWDSLSGWVSLAHAVAPFATGRPFFDDVVVTGSHAASLAAVHDGDADVAAIDAVTYRLIVNHLPELVDGVSIVGRGPLIPTLPLITAAEDPEPLRDAIAAALADPVTNRACDRLLIEEFFPLDESDYAPVAELGTLANRVIPPRGPVALV